MAIGATAASGWPQKFAYLSAAIFTAASGGTNLIYGWQKGGDLPSSCVWAGVSAGVAIIFALSWPALIKSLEAKRWSAALIALVALALAGAYSVTAALGSAAGGRTNAAAAEKDTTETRRKAQAAYDKASADLETLKPSRPVAELEALVAGARPVCHVVVTNGSRQTVCAAPAALVAELGRAKRRTELEAKMDSASVELKATGTAKVANSDAKALQRYLAAAGIDIGADRLNDLLVLLAVLMIEAGGGLSLALGIALSAPPAARPEAEPSAAEQPAVQPVTPLTAAPVSPVHLGPASPSTPVVTVRHVTAGPVRPVTADGDGVDGDVLAWLRQQGGQAVGVRPMAEALGRPRTTLSDQLRRLAGHGRVTLTPGRRGLVIELAGAGRPN